MAPANVKYFIKKQTNKQTNKQTKITKENQKQNKQQKKRKQNQNNWCHPEGKCQDGKQKIEIWHV